MVIRKAAFGFVDVFLGEGWDNWSRIRKIKTPHGFKVCHVSGIRLNKHQLQQVDKRI